MGNRAAALTRSLSGRLIEMRVVIEGFELPVWWFCDRISCVMSAERCGRYSASARWSSMLMQ